MKSVIGHDAEEEPRSLRRVCVYCASSRTTDDTYFQAARRLGRSLAVAGIDVVYGGGAVGSMGHLADAALEAGGRVIGVIPRFMVDLEWGHVGVTELQIVDDIHQRKRLMMKLSDALVALPGGSGTLEELVEALTWKRLGLYGRPVIIVNIGGFYDPLVALLERMIAERFMDPRHRDMWSVVAEPEEAIAAIHAAPVWPRDVVKFA